MAHASVKIRTVKRVLRCSDKGKVIRFSVRQPESKGGIPHAEDHGTEKYRADE